MNRGRKATPEMLAHKAQKAIQEPRGLKEKRAIQARKVPREIPVQLELLARRGRKAILAQPARGGRRENKARKASRDRQDRTAQATP